MAPEVLQGAEPSFASDLWSLGCIFYEMFAGTYELSNIFLLVICQKIIYFLLLHSGKRNGKPLDTRLPFILLLSYVICKLPLSSLSTSTWQLLAPLIYLCLLTCTLLLLSIHYMHRPIPTHALMFCGLSVCVCVGHDHELYNNSWTDRDAVLVWGQTCVGQRY